MRNLYYVAIEGTIGVGKTSLANLLSDKLGAKLVLEAFEDNPFLADFYDDPERHAFQTQLWFLLQRYQQQQDLRQVDMFQNLVITDYMFVKDRLFASLNLNEKEMSLYDTVANMMERNVIHPDLVIFSRRIQKRSCGISQEEVGTLKKICPKIISMHLTRCIMNTFFVIRIRRWLSLIQIISILSIMMVIWKR